ncbi:MAG TPA: imidazolonepropionase [Terriglobales bacterium]|nr:imidazolonepropionase [Terriglobales bacterium]
MGKRREQHDKKAALVLLNIGQLLTVRVPTAAGPRRGGALRELGIITDAAVLCVAGKIVSVGKTRQALKDPWIKKHSRRLTEIDCAGRVVLPGFVDSHTHPVFTGPRLVDFEKRVSGATYEEIAEAGGGIRSSMKGVRGAAKSELAARVLNTLATFAAHGTISVEAKSGYGLSLESELKSLEAIRSAARKWPGTVAPTLLGAHVVPPEFKGRAADYVKLVCDEMIPRTAKRKLATCVDVFCDRGAFTEEQCVQILRAARNHGLHIRAHVSQLTRTSLQRFLSLQPLSLDHLDFVDDRDIAMLAKSKTLATLVPGANYFLGLRDYPPARKLIDCGAAVALATDYNPGTSPTASMTFVLSLACTHMKMSPAEAIVAATVNGAWALGLADRKGSLETGKDADLAVFDVKDYRELAYWFGTNQCVQAIANGRSFSRASLDNQMSAGQSSAQE